MNRTEEGWSVELKENDCGDCQERTLSPINSAGQKEDICDVCRLIDGDLTRKSVTYCGFCKAWMCEKCRKDPIRRARAVLAKVTAKDEISR